MDDRTDSGKPVTAMWAMATMPETHPIRNAASLLVGGGYILYAAADQSPFSVGVGIVVGLVMAYMAMRQEADKRRRDKAQKDFRDDLEAYLQLIAALKDQMQQDAARSHKNEECMRRTLHDTHDHLQKLTFQRDELVHELAETKRLLAEATVRLTQLTTATAKQHP